MKFDKEEEELEEVSPRPLLLSVEQEEVNEEKVNPPSDDQLPEEEEEEEEEDEDESEEEEDDGDESEEEQEDVDDDEPDGDESEEEQEDVDDDEPDGDEEENEEEEEDVNDEVSEGGDGEEHDEEEEEEEVEEQAEEEEEEEEEGEEEPPSTTTHVPTTASSYLVFHHGERNRKQTFYSISEDNYSVRSVPDMCGMSCYASSQGWLVMLDNYSDQCFLLNPVSMEKIQLPPMKMTSSYRKADHCVLTSSPSDNNNCVVMFVSSDHVACLFCHPNDQKWTRKALGPSWKNGLKSVFNCIDAVGSCNGKIYIVYCFGAAIKVLHITNDDHDHTDETTTDEYTRTTTFRVLEKIKIEDENRPLLQRFNNITTNLFHLVESCGEIFLVIKIYWGGSGHNEDIYNFEVYKLNSSSNNNGPAWEKVESLGGDRLFFLGKYSSFSFPASKIGMKENYIFFFESGDECLYSYNMEDQSISIDLPCPNIIHPRTPPYWMLPIV